MSKSGPSVLQKAWGSACEFWPYAHPPRIPARGNVAKHRANKFPVTKFLTIFAACLSAVFVSSIVFEAFDSDLGLWPFGAEDFTVALQDQLVTGSQPFSVFFALNAIQCLVMSAGAHLVLRHRPRSALATDSLSISFVFNVAEPWWQNLNAAPVLGHFF